MKEFLVIGVVVFSALAAVLWFFATIVHVKAEPDSKNGTPPGASISFGDFEGMQIVDNKGADVLATAERQVCWNRFAALAATLAATCQAGLYLWFPNP